ncbi:secreted protein (macronuclear) [Tetrahymena thermophila SB210]|uniref:Secreted protein n=1 Tax=Tetrahymena thermophila (strain SB210) TaxID=312017 RepID=Q245T7_TETTS|nr:secreted protein [Tetrahymena thermophila SB210]EAS03546.1 secreted protein [Tetrahymena thermophila SB210]|eukprot:XP_001023791.1 secreted protein [Tetrahymena thermophila SB210]
MLQENKIENINKKQDLRKVDKDQKQISCLQLNQLSTERLNNENSSSSIPTQPCQSHQQILQSQHNLQSYRCCCTVSSGSVEIQTETSSEQKQYEIRLNEYLPTRIAGIQIKKVQWSDFPGKADPEMSFWAHIYWFINYNYQVEQRQNNKNRYLDFKVRSINVSVKISNKSWVRKQTDYLLSHEQGHYLIGCLCALDFKQQVLKKRYSANYSNEINQIFNQTLKQYSNMEILYDEETNHSKHFEKQTQWFIFLYDQLKKYEEYFNPYPLSAFLLQQKILADNKENQPWNSIQNGNANKKVQLPPIQKPGNSLSRQSKPQEKQEPRSRRFSQINTNIKE